MHFRISICLLLGALALACGSESAVRPNVVLITVDTLRADHLGCYGYALPTSPRIDELCAQSVVYDAAVTPTPTTDPGHATIMTALHPSRHGVLRNGWQLADEHTTLAEWMKRAGYRTQAFVSVGHLSEANGFGQGFDEIDDDLGATSLSPVDVTDKVVRWLSWSSEPFFLWVHYWDPHGPYHPPEEHDLFYEGDDWRWLRTFTSGGGIPEGDSSLVRPGSEARIVSLYDGEIHYTDSQIGRVLDVLRERGMWSDTLVVLTADHGEMLAEIAETHGYAFDHGEYLFEPNVRVPLIVKLPDEAHAGARVAALASNMDVVPTILAGAGVESEAARFDGISMLPSDAEAADGHAEIVLQRRAPRSKDIPAFHELAVRTPGWKYVWDADSNTTWLFDLLADPGERRDRGGSGLESEERLARALDEWRLQASPVAQQVVPEDQRAALEALGYVQ